MKKLFILTVLFTALISCKNTGNQKAESNKEYASFVVKETIPAGGYIYVLGQEADSAKWFAVTAQEVNVGDVFYYASPMPMKNFYSKELDRPFDEVIFLSELSKNPRDLDPKKPELQKSSGKITTKKIEVNIVIPEGAISIAQLIENAKQYQGKKVKVKGEVVKFSPEIMKTNFAHIQDGTSFNDKYDLTITTSETLTSGSTYTFEGTVILDRDYGYGYKYDILLDSAVVLK